MPLTQLAYHNYTWVHDDTGLKYVKDEYDKKIVTPNNLVMANTGATCGRAYRGKNGILSNNLFKISFDKEVFNTDYFFRYLSS